MNSLFVAAVATALCVLFGAMAGYALARLRFPGRDLIFLLFLASHHDPAGGRRRAAAPGHDQGRLGEHLPGADPAAHRQRARRLHLSPVLPLLPARAGGGRDHRRRGRVPHLLQDRAAFGAQPDDRRHRHRLHIELEQFPVAAARHLRRGHEDASRRHRRLRAGRRLAHAAGGLFGGDGGRDAPLHPLGAAVPGLAALLHRRHQHDRHQGPEDDHAERGAFHRRGMGQAGRRADFRHARPFHRGAARRSRARRCGRHRPRGARRRPRAARRMARDRAGGARAAAPAAGGGDRRRQGGAGAPGDARRRQAAEGIARRRRRRGLDARSTMPAPPTRWRARRSRSGRPSSTSR